MKLSQLNEAQYSGRGGGQAIEQQYALYDVKQKMFIGFTPNTQTGISRKNSFTINGITFFSSFEEAEEAVRRLYEKLGQPYKEGDEYFQRGSYRALDKRITLTAKQAASINKQIAKKREALRNIRIATVTATI